jgi:Lrp/AsnC family transcriptional regulator, leucine-responsive regulatory protein
MPELDQIDRQLLRAVQKDSRISNAALAESVGLSEAPCWRRLRKLETEGYIQGYHADLNRRELGFSVLAFVHVRISAHALDLASQFEEAIQSMPTVLSCHNVTGADDYILQVLARDLDDYAGFTIAIRKLPGVISIHSSLNLREIKSTSAIPI